MQVKKPQYDIYSPMMDVELKHLRQHPKSRIGKDATRSEGLAEIFRMAPDFANSLSLHIYAEEYYWLRTGANALFPENASLLKFLHDSLFEGDAITRFTLPFPSFMVSVPSGFACEGIRIPSFLVTCIRYHDTQALITSPFGRLAQQVNGLRIRLEDAPEDDVAISIAYRDPMDTSAYARTQISATQIPEILGANLGEHPQLKRYPNYTQVTDASEHDLKIQKIILRMVAGLGASTAGAMTCVRQGYPGGSAPKMVGRLPDPCRVMTLVRK